MVVLAQIHWFLTITIADVMANSIKLKRKITDKTAEIISRMRKGYTGDFSKIIEAIYAVEYIDGNVLEDHEKDSIISYYSNYV